MPPKQTITKEIVITAALTIIRKHGLTALSARNVAHEIGCSTQPVYSCFKNMEDLERVVIEKAFEFTREKYFTRHKTTEDKFKEIGLGYLALAKNERHLFEILYLSGAAETTAKDSVFPMNTESLTEIMETDPLLKGLPKEDLKDMLLHMWIYTHGLATMVRINPNFTDAFLEAALDRVGQALIRDRKRQRGILVQDEQIDAAADQTPSVE